MKTMSFLASATIMGVSVGCVRAFQSPMPKSLTQIVGGGGPSRPSGPVSITRDGVKRHLWNSIFGAAGKNEIDYSTVKGMAAKEAAEYALAGQVKDKSKDGNEFATFAGGCFWGLELAYQRVPGVIDTSVGYTQGKEDKPTYDYVCSGMSGHTEAVQVIFNPQEVTYEYLCKLLLTRINPTLKNQVGNDRGTIYAYSWRWWVGTSERGLKLSMSGTLLPFLPPSFLPSFLPSLPRSLSPQARNIATVSTITTKHKAPSRKRFSKRLKFSLEASQS